MTDEERAMKPKLADFIQAGYPCLYLRTVEPQVAEKRILSAIGEIDVQNEGDARFAVWKSTTGMTSWPLQTPYEDQDRDVNSLGLREALAHIEQNSAAIPKRPPIFSVFHNVRTFLNQQPVVQQLVDTVLVAPNNGSVVFLVGAHLDLPPELRTLVTYVDCPLPSKDDIEKHYNVLIQAYEDDINLPKAKEDRKELIRVAANAAVGLDTLGSENALSLSLATADEVNVRIIGAQKEQEVKKSDILEFFPTDEGLSDVGGMDVLKGWLERRKRVFSPEAREFGLPFPKGILIVGPAGTGKSLSAKAVSNFMGIPLIRLDMGRVFRSLVGESEAAMRLALQVAEAVSPVVLWIDEIEKGLAGAETSGSLDSGVTARVVSTILTWRQETTYPIMLMATANNVTGLPSMVYRKGRFDEVFATDLPTTTEREEIFKIHISKRDRDPADFNIEQLVTRTFEYTGAEIEAVFIEGMHIAFDKGDEVETKHVLQAVKETVPQATRDKEELAAIRDWVATRARKVSSEDVVKEGTKVRALRSKKSNK